MRMCGYFWRMRFLERQLLLLWGGMRGLGLSSDTRKRSLVGF